MIPYPYKFVDFGGTDLAEINGKVVGGIYNRIIMALNKCGEVVLYNWSFAGLPISPSYCNIEVGLESLIVNGIIEIREDDTVWVESLIPDPPSLVPLSATENGQYSPVDYNADGFSVVTVEVPIPPIGKYQEVVPNYIGLSAGFIANNGAFQQWTAVTNYMEYAALDEGKYLVCMGETAGDRFRVALFPSKSFSDFEPYINDVASSSIIIYNPETPITPASGLSGEGLTRRFIFQTAGCMCLILTSANSQVSKPILLKIQEE